MPDVLPSSARTLSLLTCAEMAQCDRWAMGQGTPGVVLMEAAGRAVAEAIRARWSPRPVLVVCGPGNNGGDGHVIARLLHEAGWPVRWRLSVPLNALHGDAAHHAQRTATVLSAAALGREDLEGTSLVVDAVFGAGLTRPVDGLGADVLRRARDAGVPIVAVDVPSGVHGDTGADWGATAADLTVTFFRKKRGHVLMPGRALCGELLVRDIGIADAALDATCASPPSGTPHENAPLLWQADWAYPVDRRVNHRGAADLHKYARGHAVVLGGAVMTGAARLAARAAARVGAGLTTLLVPQQVWPVYATALLCSMVQALDDGDGNALSAAWTRHLGQLKWHSLVMGPGAALGLPGDDASATLRSIAIDALMLAQGRGVVLDADALTAFEAQPETLFRAVAGPVVLTPHEGEFRRLFGHLSEADKIARTREAARVSGAVVLHKGPDTVVACPEGRVVVNTNGPASLATAGSGDVLSGLIGGLLAQGVPAFEAACAAAWVHGEAAQAFGPGLLADDLPEQVPAVLRRLWGR